MNACLAYDDFSIELLSTAKGKLEARVSHQSGDGSPTPLVLPAELEDPAVILQLESEVQLRTLRRHARPEPRLLLEKIGADLFDALFHGGVGEAFREACRLAHGAGRGLRLRLVFDPDSGHGPIPLAALPWEALYDRSNGRFLSQNPRTPVVRYLRRGRFDDPRLQTVTGSLRVLIVAPMPSDVMTLDAEAEKYKIAMGFDRDSSAELHFCASPSLASLRADLLRCQPHIAHFACHGDFDPQTGEGALLLIDEHGKADQVTGSELTVLIQSCTDLKLIVLNACNSGTLPRCHGLDPFSGVATALVRDGLPAVVAMQFPISDSAAILFSEAFYRAIALGRPLEVALTEGRQKIHDQLRNGEWLTPALYLRVAHGQLFQSGKGAGMDSRARSREPLIQKLTDGFIGRQFVFDAIEHFLRSHTCGYFILEGDPGVGKTAILAFLVKRHDYLHHFNIRSESDSNRTPHFLANLCAQLIQRYGLTYSMIPTETMEGPAFLYRLLDEVSAMLEGDQRLVIAVDALDEVADAETHPENNILGLPAHLPKGVHFILTTRRLPKDKPTRWRLRAECPLERFILRHDDPANQFDIRVYVEREADLHHLAEWWLKHGLSRQGFVDLLQRLSEGNFRYLHHVLPELRPNGLYWDRLATQLPQGLEEYYLDHWARIRELCGQDWYEFQLPVLAALTVVQRPLPFELILYLTEIRQPVRALVVLLAWEAFLHIEPDTSGNVRLQRYRFYHSTFIDFIARQAEVNLTTTTHRMKERLYTDFLQQNDGY